MKALESLESRLYKSPTFHHQLFCLLNSPLIENNFPVLQCGCYVGLLLPSSKNYTKFSKK